MAAKLNFGRGAYQDLGNPIASYQDQQLKEQLARQAQSNADRSYAIQEANAKRLQSEYERKESERKAQQDIIKNFDGTTEEYGANYNGVNKFNDIVQQTYTDKLKNLGATQEQIASLQSGDTSGDLSKFANVGVEQKEIDPLLAKLNKADNYSFTGSEFSGRGHGMTDQQVAKDKLFAQLMGANMTGLNAMSTATGMTGDLSNRTQLSTLARAQAEKDTAAVNARNELIFKEQNKAYVEGVKANAKDKNTLATAKAVNEALGNFENDIIGFNDQDEARKFTKDARDAGYSDLDIFRGLTENTRQEGFWRDQKIDSTNIDEFMSSSVPNLGATSNVAKPTLPELQKAKVGALTASDDNWSKFWGGPISPTTAQGSTDPYANTPEAADFNENYFSDDALKARMLEDQQFRNSTDNNVKADRTAPKISKDNLPSEGVVPSTYKPNESYGSGGNSVRKFFNDLGTSIKDNIGTSYSSKSLANNKKYKEAVVNNNVDAISNIVLNTDTTISTGNNVPGSSQYNRENTAIDTLKSEGFSIYEIENMAKNKNLPTNVRNKLNELLGNAKEKVVAKPKGTTSTSKPTYKTVDVTQEELVNELNATAPDKSGMSTASIKVTDKDGSMLPEGIVRIGNKYFKVKN